MANKRPPIQGIIPNSHSIFDGAHRVDSDIDIEAKNKNLSPQEKEAARHTELIFAELKNRAKGIVAKDQMERWEHTTRRDLGFSWREAEKISLCLDLADAVNKGATPEDVVKLLADAKPNGDIDKDLIFDDVERYAKSLQEPAVRRKFDIQVYNYHSEVLAFTDKEGKYYDDKYAYPTREAFDRYDAQLAGVEYDEHKARPVNEVLRDEFKERGRAVCRADRMRAWDNYVDQAFKDGHHAIAKAEAILGAMELYESGARLRDVRDDIIKKASIVLGCDPNEITKHLTSSYQDGFGKMPECDSEYLYDKLYIAEEPAKSMPALAQEILAKSQGLIPEELQTQWEKTIIPDGMYAGMQYKEISVEYLQMLHDGVDLDEIKDAFQNDERLHTEFGQLSVASLVERFGPVEGMANYMLDTHEMPRDTRDGKDEQDIGPVIGE